MPPRRTAQLPDWPGRASFAGELIHSSAYRNPEPYRDRDVLVVGSGNSGAEIAADLAEGGARKVWISIRTPPNIVRRNFGPIANQQVAIAIHRLPGGFVDRMSLLVQRASVGDLSRFGLNAPTRGEPIRGFARGATPGRRDGRCAGSGLKTSDPNGSPLRLRNRSCDQLRLR